MKLWNLCWQTIVNWSRKLLVGYIKGIDILLKAATLYENNNILTILAGDGELFDDMKKLAKKLNLKNIFFIFNSIKQQLRS